MRSSAGTYAESTLEEALQRRSCSLYHTAQRCPTLVLQLQRAFLHLLETIDFRSLLRQHGSGNGCKTLFPETEYGALYSVCDRYNPGA